MPFAIMLMPAEFNAPLPHYRSAIEHAVQANGGKLGPHGDARLPDGGHFVYADNQFQLEQLTPDICRVVFKAALQTNNYVDAGSSEVTPLKVVGTTLKTPPGLGPAVTVANPGILCAKLQSRLVRWKQDMGRLRRDGVIGADDQPLEPPPGPGTEPRLSRDPPGLAAECEKDTRETASTLKWQFVRGTLTRNAQWGVVWRADLAPGADPTTWFRDVCWRKPGAQGTGSIRILTRPLNMFDKSQTMPPLPSQ